jgi:hypothetical protein
MAPGAAPNVRRSAWSSDWEVVVGGQQVGSATAASRILNDHYLLSSQGAAVRKLRPSSAEEPSKPMVKVRNGRRRHGRQSGHQGQSTPPDRKMPNARRSPAVS